MNAPACCTLNNNGAMLTLLTGLVNTVYENYCQLEDPRKYPVDINPSSDYDFIVIGSGQGSVVANRLSENSKWRILVLEEGKLPTAATSVPGLVSSVQNSCEVKKNEGDPGSCPGSENGQCSIVRAKVLGGASAVAKNLYFRQLRQVFDEWIRTTGCPNWDYLTALKYFKKSEDYWGDESYYHAKNGILPVSRITSPDDPVVQKFIKAFNTMGYSLIDPHGSNQSGLAVLDFIGRNFTKLNVGELYLGNAKHRENLYVATDTQVKKLIYDPNCNRIIGVSILKNGEPRTIRATKEVILAAGVWGTPTILLQSGIGPKVQLESLGIQVVKENAAIGKNLLINPSTFFPIVALTKYSNSDGDFETDYLFDFLLKRNGAFTSFDYENLAGYINSKSNPPGLDYPDIKIVPTIVSKNSNNLKQLLDRSNYNQQIKEMFLDLNSKTALLLFRVINMQSKSVGDVILKSKTDENPIIRPNLFSNPNDYEQILDGIDFIEKLIKTEGLQELGAELVDRTVPGCEGITNSRDYKICVIRLLTVPIDSVGTCSMGTVVDCDLKFKNIDGLRIVDFSVMPVLGTDISVAQGVMLAEYGADLVKQTWENQV